MKNRNLITYGILLSLFFIQAVILNAQQTALVGELRNNQGFVTNFVEATRVLKGGLSSGATVSNIRVEWEQASGKYFLVGEIGNDAIGAKAVELHVEGNSLMAVAGPGIEIKCTGNKCGYCRFVIQNWRLMCICDDPSAGDSGSCDYTIGFTIGL